MKILSNNELVNINGGRIKIGPIGILLGACVAAHELGHNVGRALYHALN